MTVQHTLKKKLRFEGLGVHSGASVAITLKPADEDAGITFVHVNYEREPLQVGQIVPLNAMHATILPQKSWSLSTVEHLVAAIRMSGLDNVLVEVNAQEIPILDGSAAPFFHHIMRAGLQAQSKPRRYLTPREKIFFDDQGRRQIMLLPLSKDAPVGSLYCSYTASFDHYALGVKKKEQLIDAVLFKNSIAPARTFGFIEQLPLLRKHNLAQASSLGNTVVYAADEAVNDTRVVDEWFNHKVLDFIGDLGLLPYAFTGAIEAAQTGHAFNRLIMQDYKEHPERWIVV